MTTHAKAPAPAKLRRQSPPEIPPEIRERLIAAYKSLGMMETAKLVRLAPSALGKIVLHGHKTARRSTIERLERNLRRLAREPATTASAKARAPNVKLSGLGPLPAALRKRLVAEVAQSSYADVGRKVGIHAITLSQYCREPDRRVQAAQVEKLAKGLGFAGPGKPAHAGGNGLAERLDATESADHVELKLKLDRGELGRLLSKCEAANCSPSTYLRRLLNFGVLP